MPVLKARYVVPVTSSPIRDGAIAVIADSIKAVGTAEEIAGLFPSEPVEDFGNSALIPGFVNCHAHLELTGFRGIVDHLDDDFMAWLLEITRLRKLHEGGNALALAARLGACEAAAAGVTTIGDVAREGAVSMDALQKAGLRGIVYQETEFSPDNAQAELDFGRLSQRFEKLTEGGSRLVEAGISPHTPYTVSARLFEKITRYATENNVPLTIHASESEAELKLMLSGAGFFSGIFQNAGIDWPPPGMRTIQYLAELGVLDASPLLVHCVHINSDELDLISKHRAKIAHCPKSNAKFGHGIAPLVDFLGKGITTGLGSDSMASNNCCDMLEEARFAGLFSRVRNSSEDFVDPEKLFSLATIGGAAALGLEHKVGSLEPGKQADLAVISLNGSGQTPVNDIYSILVFSTNASAVSKTVVAGQTVYESGIINGMDIDTLKSSAASEFEF